MDKILNITARLENKKRKEQIEAFRLKVEAVRMIAQCSTCQLKCAMCGHHVEAGSCCDSTDRDLNLCENCQAEYADFQDMMSGKRIMEVFWHNEAWMNLWSTWLKYQEAIRKFKSTPEFKQLAAKSER